MRWEREYMPGLRTTFMRESALPWQPPCTSADPWPRRSSSSTSITFPPACRSTPVNPGARHPPAPPCTGRAVLRARRRWRLDMEEIRRALAAATVKSRWRWAVDDTWRRTHPSYFRQRLSRLYARAAGGSDEGPAGRRRSAPRPGGSAGDRQRARHTANRGRRRVVPVVPLRARGASRARRGAQSRPCRSHFTRRRVHR